MNSQSAEAVAEWQEFELQLNGLVQRLSRTIGHINLASRDASYARSAVKAVQDNAAQLGTLVGECRKLHTRLRESRNASLNIEDINSKLTNLEEADKAQPAAIKALLDPLIKRPEAPKVVLDHLRDILATCRMYNDNHPTKEQVVGVQHSLDRLVQGLRESEQRHLSLAGKLDKISELPSTQAVIDRANTTSADPLQALTSEINEAAERPPQNLMDKLSTIASEPPQALTDQLHTKSAELLEGLVHKIDEAFNKPPQALTDRLDTLSSQLPNAVADKIVEISAQPLQVLMDKLDTLLAESARPSPPRASDILRDLRLIFSEASSSSLGGEQSSSQTDIPRAGVPDDHLDDLVDGLRDLLRRTDGLRSRSRRDFSTPEDRDSLGTAESAHEAPLDSMEEYSAGGPASASQLARTSPVRNPSKRPKRARSDSDSNGAEAVAE
ncbi:hypothetical protein DL770_010638 [Monosporascus sp. CRB-9-2]|nr:hypothetical protein DL770_010638 [Monosporascus sp. CRB-9-2]